MPRSLKKGPFIHPKLAAKLRRAPPHHAVGQAHQRLQDAQEEQAFLAVHRDAPQEVILRRANGKTEHL